jgi:hypothetical protein
MLEVCGFTYDPTLDAYTNGGGGRVLRVDTIQAHTELWVAQWITETLPTLKAAESIEPQQQRQQQQTPFPASGPATTARRTGQTPSRTYARLLRGIRRQST